MTAKLVPLVVGLLLVGAPGMINCDSGYASPPPCGDSKSVTCGSKATPVVEEALLAGGDEEDDETALSPAEDVISLPRTALPPAAAEVLSTSRENVTAGFEKWQAIYNNSEWGTAMDAYTFPYSYEERLVFFNESLAFIDEHESDETGLLQLGPFAALGPEEIDQLFGTPAGNETETVSTFSGSSTVFFAEGA